MSDWELTTDVPNLRDPSYWPEVDSPMAGGTYWLGETRPSGVWSFGRFYPNVSIPWRGRELTS